MKDPGRHLLLLSLSLGDWLSKLAKAKGIKWRYEPPGCMDAKGEKTLGMIVIVKAEAALIFHCVGDFIQVEAHGIPSAKGAKLYPAKDVTGEFAMRAVNRFLEKCGQP